MGRILWSIEFERVKPDDVKAVRKKTGGALRTPHPLYESLGGPKTSMRR
jgi:hypothetical protein